MKKFLILVSAGYMACFTASAQANRSAIAAASAQDHKHMMELHIDSLRPGSGPGLRPTNYNEAKANPYPNLPDPFNIEQWQTGYFRVSLGA